MHQDNKGGHCSLPAAGGGPCSIALATSSNDSDRDKEGDASTAGEGGGGTSHWLSPVSMF